MTRHPDDHSNTQNTDLGILPDLLGYHLRLAQIALFRDFTAAVGEHGITPTLFAALALIEANTGMKQTDLARAIQLDRSSVVSVVNKLEQRSLVARRRALRDRRSTHLELTPAGQDLLNRIRPLVLAHEQRIGENFTAAEHAQLIELLTRVRTAQETS